MDDGPVATLLIGAERQIRGRIDAKTGAVTRADPAEPDVDDLLDAAGECVLKTGGEVMIVSAHGRYSSGSDAASGDQGVAQKLKSALTRALGQLGRA